MGVSALGEHRCLGFAADASSRNISSSKECDRTSLSTLERSGSYQHQESLRVP
jgi:hypothetical protein